MISPILPLSAVEIIVHTGIPLNQSYDDALAGIVGEMSAPLHSSSKGGEWNAAAFTDATATTEPAPVRNSFWHPDGHVYHITWDLGYDIDPEIRQLDTVNIWIHAEDPGRHSYRGWLSVSMDGENFTEIPGTNYANPLAQAGSHWEPVFNKVTYSFDPGEVVGFRYLRFHSNDDAASGRLQPRYVEIDAFTSTVRGPSSRPQFWSMHDGRFYVDGEWVFLKNGKLLRNFGSAAQADQIIADIDVMIDQLDYNNVSFNIYPDQLDRIGDGRVDSTRRQAFEAFKRILDHCWERGIFYSISFETYNVGGGGVPAKLFEIYPEIVARNALLEEARDVEYGVSQGRLIPSIHHPRYLKWSRDFIRNFLRDLGEERASRILYVETTVEPQYLGRNNMDADQRRAALDYSDAGRAAFQRWRMSFPTGDPRRSFNWPTTQDARDASIGNPIFNEFRAQALGGWVTGDIEAIRSVVPDVYIAVDYNGRFDDPDRLRLGDHDMFLTAIEGANIIQIAPHWDAVWGPHSWNDVIEVNSREGKGWVISEHMTANGGFPTSDSLMTSILDNTLNRGTRWGWDFVNIANNHPSDLFHLYESDWTSPVLNIIERENWDSWLSKIGAARFVPYPRNQAAHFSIWRERYFSEAERAEESVSGPDADPGGFGVSNLLRYAFGIDPRGPDRERLPFVAVEPAGDGGSPRLRLEYFRNRMARDLTLSVLVSGDLRAWNTVSKEHVVSREKIGELEKIVVEAPVAHDETQQFIRLLVEFAE